jgi:thymidylate kinase
MWKKITQPDILIFLDVSLDQAQRRRHQNCSPAEHAEQLNRLRHAREHADLYLDTNPLTAAEVEAQALGFLSDHLAARKD